MEDDVKLLSIWPSLFGQRVELSLQLKGLPYTYQEEDLGNRSHLLLTSNPVYKRIPVLIHNGTPICESRIIMEYIDETWPHHGIRLLPKNPYDRAQARFWADFIDKKVYDAGIGVIKSTGVEQRKGIEDLADAYASFDDALNGKLYYGGDEIGFVDVAFAPFISWLHALESIGNFELPAAEYPHTAAWMNAVSHHPAVKKAFPHPQKTLEFFRGIRNRFHK